MANAQKQLDLEIEQTKQIRQRSEIQITGGEELESKPLEEYEKDIREQFSQRFLPESST